MIKQIDITDQVIAFRAKQAKQKSAEEGLSPQLQGVFDAFSRIWEAEQRAQDNVRAVDFSHPAALQFPKSLAAKSAVDKNAWYLVGELIIDSGTVDGGVRLILGKDFEGSGLRVEMESVDLDKDTYIKALLNSYCGQTVTFSLRDRTTVLATCTGQVAEDGSCMTATGNVENSQSPALGNDSIDLYFHPQ